MRRTLTAIEVLILLLTLGLGASLLMPALMKTKATSCRPKCSNQLRHLGLAALQYSDDKRFFPHVGGLRQADGDAADRRAPVTKTVRALMWYGYADSTEGWICPSSDDTFVPITAQATRDDLREWFWDGRGGASTDLSPFVDRAPDPSVRATRELSYGWTRRGLNRNTRSTTALGADRAVRGNDVSLARRRARARWGAIKPGELGNHADGWNVLFADASVQWYSTSFKPDRAGKLSADFLVGTGKDEGNLAIEPQPWLSGNP